MGGDEPGRRPAAGVRVAARRSPAPPAADELSGAVDVCVDVPRLSVDRPFTYLLPEGAGAGTGSLVSVPFHGRTVRGWVLGPAAEAPAGRILPVRRVRSPVRFFGPDSLRLLRWVSERYLVPLSVAIERSHPPRVAGLERGFPPGPAAPGPAAPPRPGPAWLAGALPGLLEPGSVSWVRPLPGEEAEACLAATRACLEAGRRALVLVPEASPLPDTARAVLDAFGSRAAAFLGGDERERYRTWLGILGGAADVVVGTRPAAFAPLADLGLVWISREVHPAHREDRAPYYHVREVASARAALEGCACVLAALSPSVETATAAAAGRVRSVRPPRALERRAAPLVETVPAGAEDRSVRLSGLLRRARGAALIVSRSGYGLARVCRSCGEPAACAACGGPIAIEAGRAVCRACGAPGRCAACGAADMGIERGGTERIAEWARRIAGAPVDLAGGDEPAGEAARPDRTRVLVGTAAAVNDVGPVGLDLVAILDPDRALARPGMHAGERALATWMECAAWAGPRAAGGRALLQTRHPGHPAVQALIRWEPVPFLLAEAARRAEGGFAPGHPVFRVEGPAAAPGGAPDLGEALRAAGASFVLGTPGPDGGTVCLVAVRPDALGSFRGEVLRLARQGAVARVEAEPQL